MQAIFDTAVIELQLQRLTKNKTMSFNFLKNIKFKEDLPSNKKTVGASAPTGLTLRVYASGRVYPSPELVAKFNLEYQPDDGGNGMDYFQSKDWKPYPSNVPATVLVAFTPRTEPKISLFGSRRGETTSVLTQGPECKELWKMLVDTYGAEVPKDAAFVDITVFEEFGIKTEDGIFLIPKTVARGEKKGELTYQRRENITLYPLGLNVGDRPNDVVQEDLLQAIKD